MRLHLPTFALAAALACGAWAQEADPASDAPQERFVPTAPVPQAASYEEALARWRTPEEVNGWIGAHFRYDMARALQLSETQRARGVQLDIHAPEVFFARPEGVCVDLARFGVQTLRAIAPAVRPAYLMIEFDPATLQGQTLRRHWLALFERKGRLWFFADSKRPGHLAGPHATVEEFISAYALYRGRVIVAHKVLDTYERRMRVRANRRERNDGS